MKVVWSREYALGLTVLIWLTLGSGESGHPHLLGILPDFMHWSLSHARDGSKFLHVANGVVSLSMKVVAILLSYLMC